jgi:pSer/pThr/pTyr-binding forkhead associated (FHA) protein
VITAGPKKGERIPLGTDAITIGRASDSTLVIRDDYTSTRHAVLELRRGTWQISDLDSTNGTLVNGERISSPTAVVPGTPITVGQTVFDIREDS